MRRTIYVLISALVLALPASALAATKVVNITEKAFKPGTVTVSAGDTVQWVNKDNAQHQVVANNGTFASPILRANQTFSHTFTAAGRFAYHDALHPALKGTVVVQGPPPSVTLGAGSPILVYGQETALTGTVSSGQAGQSVAISATPYGTTTAQQIATVTSGVGGGFALAVKPAILTTYVATWGKATSQQVTLQVRPKLTLLPSQGRMYAKVISPRSYAGGFIYLQRLSPFGQWVTILKLKLGPLSGRIFTLPRRCGVSTYHVYMPVAVAGTGYLDGWSGTQKKRRRC